MNSLLKYLTVLVILSPFSLKVYSQTNTWTGATDTDWHKDCNWSLNAVPTCSDPVLIPNTGNQPIVSDIAHCSTIEVQSSSGAEVEVQSSSGARLDIGQLGGCSGTPLKISAPSITGTTPASRCGTGTVTLGASSSSGTINWFSSATGGSSLGTGTSFTTPSISSTTTYYVDATDGCTTPSRTAVVAAVDADPGAANNTTSTASICETQTKTLTGNPAGGSWSIVSGGGNITGTTYNPPNIASNTNVTIRYTIPANGACAATTSNRTFTVNYNPGAANNTTSTADICDDETKTLTGTPPGGSWSIVSGGGNITGTTYNPSSIGSKTIRYTIAANGACAATNSNRTFDVISCGMPATCKSIGGSGNDHAFSIVESTDGGFVLAGYTNSYGAGDVDMYILKINSDGTLGWTRTVGGTGYDAAWAIINTSDGGYAVAGRTNSYGAGGYDMYIVKLNSSGTVQWTRTVGGAGAFSGDVAHSIAQTNDGGYAIVGNTATLGYSSGSTDCYIVKLNSSGVVQWTRTVGGTNAEAAYGITATSDGGCAITGYTMSYGAGNQDVYVVKLNSSGTVQWTRTVGGTSGDKGYSIVQTTDGGYFISGSTLSFGAGGFDYYMIKLNSAGTVQWTRTAGGPDSEYEFLHKITGIQANDGGYAVVGTLLSVGVSDGYMVKLNSSGSVSWTQTIGGSDAEILTSITNTSDGGFALCGATEENPGPSYDFYFTKMDADGSNCCTTGTGAGSSGSGGASGSGNLSGSGGASGTGGASGIGGLINTNTVTCP